MRDDDVLAVVAGPAVQLHAAATQQQALDVHLAGGGGAELVACGGEGEAKETDRALLGIHVYSLVPRLLGGK